MLHRTTLLSDRSPSELVDSILRAQVVEVEVPTLFSSLPERGRVEEQRTNLKQHLGKGPVRSSTPNDVRELAGLTLCLLVIQVLAVAPIARSYLTLLQRKLKMLLNLLRQGNQRLAYFLDISRGELDQLVQVAEFEESVGINTQEPSESRAVSFDGDALQHLQ